MLSLLFKKVIKLYWKLIPEEKRRVCLYRESCSKYVFKTIETSGFVAGWNAFIYRMKNCNNSYILKRNNNNVYILTSKNKVITATNANPFVIR